MLNALSGSWVDTHRTGELEAVYSDQAPVTLEALLELVDRFANLPPLTSYNPEQSGDHAWLSIQDRSFIFHVYFDEDGVSFELYGPFPAGAEMQSRDPYDGSGLEGRLSHDDVNQAVSLLDGGESPREYVQQHGEDVEAADED